MFDKNLGYDPASPESIESYALYLENKTFLEVVSDKGNISSDAVKAYANKFRKGGLGNLLEETNLLKGVGAASNAMGKLIGSIPKVKDGQVDEFFIEKGEKIRSGVQGISRDVIESFAEVSNPNTAGFINKLEDVARIYNHTKEICFDKNHLYLIAG